MALTVVLNFDYCYLQGEPMPVVYRMRGLLGDATEDMVNSLDSGSGKVI